MATAKSDIETVAAWRWDDVDQLVQTHSVFVYHLGEADNLTRVAATISLASLCDISYT